MTIEFRTADGDQIVSPGALPRLKREAAAKGLHLASWPLLATGNCLYAIRHCASAAECDDVEMHAYLMFPLPPRHQR